MNSKTKDCGHAHRGMFILAALLAALFAALPVRAQSFGEGADPASLAAGHSGAILAMAYDPVRNCVISTGADGFIGIWDVRANAATDRFQASPYAVQAMALRPGKPQAALVESDGVGTYRISAWDYERKQNLFALRFRDPVNFITYSAGGGFLMVARSGRSGVVFIHPETGQTLDSPPDLPGSVSFAATGPSERTMMIYAPSGQISYWQLDTGQEIQHSATIPNLASPILVGNNRYLCGIDSRGLAVLDAVTGKEIARDSGVGRGKLFPASSPDRLEFMCLGAPDSGTSRGTLTQYAITAQGKLEGQIRDIVPQISSGARAANGGIALGAADGGIWLLGADSREPRAMDSAKPTRIRAAAVSGDRLAYIAEDQFFSVIPLDYRLLRDRAAIAMEPSQGNTQVSGDPDANGRFLLWQTDKARSVPLLISGAGTKERRDMALSRLQLRHPLRSASLLGGQALFLDSSGAVTLLSTDTGAGKFTYAATDPLDLSFLDKSHIIIGHAGLGQNAPFLLVDTETQETVPFAYPAMVGAKLYRAPDGTAYGGVVEGLSENAVTALLLLDMADPPASRRLAEYQGEDTAFIIARSGKSLATTMGGNGPALYGEQGFVPFERGPSLPANLLGSDGYFIVLGGDGTISWHSPATGSLLARLRLLETEWILESPEQGRLRGPLQK